MLLSRPMKEADGFVEQSLSERASERRARKVSYILLGVALLSGVLFLLAVPAGTKLRLPWQLCCAWAHRFPLP